MTKPIIITVEGNIGAGKSTLLEYIREYTATKKNDVTIAILQEPVEDWKTVGDTIPATPDNHILSKFYEDPAKYCFTFHTIVYMSIFQQLFSTVLRLKNTPSIVITERSLNTSHDVFTNMLYDDKKLDNIQYQALDRILNHYKIVEQASDVSLQTDAIIYLSCPPKKCLERIAQRGRDGEANISLEYLHRCEAYHQTNLLPKMPKEKVYFVKEDFTREDVVKIFEFIDSIHSSTV